MFSCTQGEQTSEINTKVMKSLIETAFCQISLTFQDKEGDSSLWPRTDF